VGLVELVQARGRQLDRRARDEREHRRAAGEEVEQRHLAEAVARAQLPEQVRLARPVLEDRDLARLQNEHRLGLVALAEEELALRDGHRRRSLDERGEHVGADPAEDRHALQRCDA
jgi:hypothetical protein